MTPEEVMILKTLLKKLRANQIKTLAEKNNIDDIETWSTEELYEFDDYDNLIACVDGILYCLSENE